jgi:hypothetical protein
MPFSPAKTKSQRSFMNLRKEKLQLWVGSFVVWIDDMTSIFFKRSEPDQRRQRVHLPHLQRFAAPPFKDGWREEPTTIYNDIRHAAHVEMKRLAAARQGPTRTLEPMLGVISYCYAKGLLLSADIERELWESPAFVEVFGDNLPTAQQIKSFRRRNRAIILSIIEQAIAEFFRREPTTAHRQVLAAEINLADSARAMAQWLLDMANFSDELESD